MSFEKAFQCIGNRKRGRIRTRFRQCRNGCQAPPRRELLPTVLSSVLMHLNGQSR